MGVTNQAIDHILNAEFASGSRHSSWYLGVIAGGGSQDPILRATDTLLVRSWAEHFAYGGDSGTKRPAWGASLGSAGFGNATPVLIYPNTPLSIFGVLLTSAGLQGETTGQVLFATLPLVGGARTIYPPHSLEIQLTIAVSS